MNKVDNRRVSSFTYSPGTGASRAKLISFSIPPLDKTQLISVPEATGVADVVVLEADPVNLSLCGTTQKRFAPGSFDFRQEFSDFISPIINQGSCGSCWAIASTQALSSRFALIRNQPAVPLSAAYMLYCTRDTFSSKENLSYGCTGGSLVDAYWFFTINGTVTAECLRYDSLGTWDPTNSTNTNLRNREVEVGSDGTTTSKTEVMCPMNSCPSLVDVNAPPDAKGRPLVQPWIYKTAISYIVPGTAKQSGASEANIREEIWSNGPVSSGFQVTEDFIVYWKGLLEKSLKGAALVYVPGAPDDFTNPVQGSHAIQIVGWGQQSEYGDIPFWIVANSWGATNTATTPAGLNDFGNNGYFMMVRGRNAAAIESNVVAGVPRCHPNIIGALGRPSSDLHQRMCNVTRYEINLTTLKALNSGKFVDIPDARNMYEYTMPPRPFTIAGRVKKFDVCPSDRPVRCKQTGLCMTSPVECGSAIASTGMVVINSSVKAELAGARELQQKYIQKLLKDKKIAAAAAATRGKEVKAAKRNERLLTTQTRRVSSDKARRWIFIVLIILLSALFVVVTVNVVRRASR